MIKRETLVKKLSKEGIKLSYDESHDAICINGVRAKMASVKALPIYNDLVKKTDKNEAYSIILSIAKKDVVNLDAEKKAKTEEEKAAKQEAKQAAEKLKKDEKLLLIQGLKDAGYETSKDGNILDLVCNYEVALKDSGLEFKWNEFTHTPYINCHKSDSEKVKELQSYLGRVIGHDKSTNIISAITNLSRQNSFHPLKDFFTQGSWDGTERLETLFIKYFGAKDSAVNREMTRKWMTAAVKRIFEPGCKFDNMLILYDKNQRTGKSTFFERFCKIPTGGCTDESYYLAINKAKQSIDVKEMAMQIDDSWIVNFDECRTLMMEDIAFIKGFLSQTEDKIRKPYDITQTYFKRHCVFAGTTNAKTFLKDYTSEDERRFWVIDCNGQDRTPEWWNKNLPDEYIKQCWYEAYYYYKTNHDTDINYISDRDGFHEVHRPHKTFMDDVALAYVESVLTSSYSILISKDTTERSIINAIKDLDGGSYSLKQYKLRSIKSLTLAAVLKQYYRVARTPDWCETVCEVFNYKAKEGVISKKRTATKQEEIEINFEEDDD